MLNYLKNGRETKQLIVEKSILILRLNEKWLFIDAIYENVKL